MAFYNGQSVREEETQREVERRKVIDNYRAKLIDGSVLIIPLRQMNIQFDPRNLVTLDGNGTVYPSLTITDLWGKLIVTDGSALIASTWDRVTVPVPVDPNANPVMGEGWTLELKNGWKVVPSDRKGDYTVSASD